MASGRRRLSSVASGGGKNEFIHSFQNEWLTQRERRIVAFSSAYALEREVAAVFGQFGNNPVKDDVFGLRAFRPSKIYTRTRANVDVVRELRRKESRAHDEQHQH